MSVVSSEPSVQLMNHARILRMIKRMAYQIIEDHKDQTELFLYGIDTRGYDTAIVLAAELKKISKQQIKIAKLHVRMDTEMDVLPETIKGYVLVVDDVLFSGQTMMKALNKIINTIKFSELRVAVMVDRGHRMVPVQPDFAGLVSPTKLKEHVEVIFNDSGKPEEVVLYRS